MSCKDCENKIDKKLAALEVLRHISKQLIMSVIGIIASMLIFAVQPQHKLAAMLFILAPSILFLYLAKKEQDRLTQTYNITKVNGIFYAEE